MKSKPQNDVSRRALLAAGSGMALTPLSAIANPTSQPARRASPPGPARDIKVDVVVIGGGMAGVCAALAAARNGVSVALVQDRPMLGGNSSSEIRLHILGADASGQRQKEGIDARETGIMEELRLEEAVSNPQRSTSMWDLILYHAVRCTPGITLLLNTCCCGVRMGRANEIAAIEGHQLGSENTFTIHGRLFIDCTGDGRVGAGAGADFRMGREARDEFGESMAPEKADSAVLGSTILFTTRRHPQPMPFTAPSWVRRFARCEDLPHRRHANWEWGHWWVEWGGELDTIADYDRIRDELMAAALGLWDHIKNSGQHPTSENWALDWIGFLPGKRESRRFVGEHILTQQEVQRGETFEDGVAIGGWPIDLHPPAGIYSPEPPCDQRPVPLYNLPFRCLRSRNIVNLLFAGRDASASHVAFGSTRVMATGGVMGQAVGTAAALCIKSGTLPRELGRDGISALQQQLLRDDAYIIGASNNDPHDLARKAAVRASSETENGHAAHVVNGVARGVGTATNRWISDPSQPMPQWIELRFPKPARVREVHLVFDTGLHRPLTLTLQDSANARMIRSAQPETVRDYELTLLDGDGHHAVATVTGNYQRKRIHTFAPQTIQGLRLQIERTNGDPSARLFEVRAYG